MKNLPLFIDQGYNVNEYLLILSPPGDLRDKIMNLKKEFYDAYKASNALWGKPHLTLVNFVQYERFEPRIVERLKSVAMCQRPIEVELKDFGSFPSHTMYINVATKGPIRNLVKEIKVSEKLLKLTDGMGPRFIFEPHLTVARQLNAWQYENASLDYGHKTFTGCFIAKYMQLLKRNVDGSKGYKEAGRFEFLNLPGGSMRQGELFA